MKYLTGLILLAVLTFEAEASAVLQMNKAFNSLTELMPFVMDEDKFKEKKSEATVQKELGNLQKSFKLLKHDPLLKHELFAPSYELINQGLNESAESFKKGKKDFALWNTRETLGLCLECHTRLPTNHVSSFQNGEISISTKNLEDPYNLGMTYLIVRRYVDAKANFMRDFQDKLIRKDFSEIMRPLQQILMIQTKIMNDPKGMISIIEDLKTKKALPETYRTQLLNWKDRLEEWNKKGWNTHEIDSDKELQAFIKKFLLPLENKTFQETHKIDLLLSSGILSRYFFVNPESPSAPEINYWLGWIEKRLKRDQFLSSGDLYLKQCIRKYPKHKVAKKCLEEYHESVEFDFSGSGGTNIPPEIQNELDSFDKLIGPLKR